MLVHNLIKVKFMIRIPKLQHFSAIARGKSLQLRGSVVSSREKNSDREVMAEAPIQNLLALFAKKWRVKIECFSKSQNMLDCIEVDTDSFGLISHKISRTYGVEKVYSLRVYEISERHGIEYFMGGFLVQEISDHHRVVVCDFDKTLVHTRYHTAKEIYHSLNRPLHYFPTLTQGLNILHSHIEREFFPVILSSSPHFYEKAIRDWLYQHKVFAGHIVLKDYRSLFSYSEGFYSPKDLKHQGFHKLYQLLQLIKLVGVPKELSLIGDGFESDELIYLILSSVLKRTIEPWALWNYIKSMKAFSFTTKQSVIFLDLLYYIYEKSKGKKLEINIHIRRPPFKKQKHVNVNELHVFDPVRSCLMYYEEPEYS